MDCVVDDRGEGVRAELKPALRSHKTYLGCQMIRQLDGTVKVWSPIRTDGTTKWELIRVASSMRSAHNFVHNTRAKKV